MPTQAGLKTIILLSFLLALGFLLLILSCALFANWLPLIVALLFVLSPLPNAIFGRCASPDFSTDSDGQGALDAGMFLTSIFLVSGVALPLVLNHADIIHPAACWMSIGGGIAVYATITTYSHFFSLRFESW
ncbi:vacuolar protein sorting 55 [Atractiella rhizophila]|nr:vacuolar protein sorting 55 [Atractiella rhizophila]